MIEKERKRMKNQLRLKFDTIAISENDTCNIEAPITSYLELPSTLVHLIIEQIGKAHEMRRRLLKQKQYRIDV